MRKRFLCISAALVCVLALAGMARADLIDCTVRDLQDTSSVMWDTLQTTDTLRMSGVVTGADTKASGFAFYIEDFNLAAQYRGLDIFTGGHNSFVDSGLARGQLVRVTGRVGDFGGGTELISMDGNAFGDSVRIEHNLGNPGIPGPTIVTVGDIAERSLTGEIYEGMFVRMNHTVRVTTPTSSIPGGTFMAVDNTVPSPAESILVDLTTLANPSISVPPSGTIITFLQGIQDQRGVPPALRGYRLQVRDGADIALPTPPTVNNIFAISNDSILVIFDKALDPTTAQNRFNYSRSTGKAIDSATLQPDPNSGVLQRVALATVSEPQVPAEVESVTVAGVKSSLGSVMPAPQGIRFRAGVISIAQVETPKAGHEFNGPGGSDTTQYFLERVTVRGVVTAKFGTLAVIQDFAGGLRSGIKLFAPTVPMEQGDDVTISGVPIEFFDETEFSGSNFERNHGTAAEPAAIDIAATGLDALNDTTAAGGTREVYENVLVRVHDVAIADSNVGFGEWLVKAGGPCFIDATCADTVHIDDRGEANYVYRPHTGKQLDFVMGPAEISFNVLKLEPRQDSDIDTTGVVTGVGEQKLTFALRALGANPISFVRGDAEFAITLPARGAPVLQLYDLRGRLVNTITRGRVLEPGTQTLRWNGTDAGGRRIGAGIYFAQLRLGDQVATTKVVVAD